MPDWVFTVMLVVTVAVAATSYWMGLRGGESIEREDCNRRWKKACVERGVAHWETASDGTTTFEWNEEPTDGQAKNN